ncbi:MAG: peptidase M14 [Cyclobacteriaceae bacterium]|nr:peptidase M14 [Cyclobacteriaceae bacterium]
MKIKRIIFASTSWLLFSFGIVIAQTPTAEDLTGLRAIGSPANPKVKMSWNRYHNYQQITDFCRQLTSAYPGLVTMESMGKSFENRDLWVLVISDKSTGDPGKKPGFYIDGNIHSNELQGSEIAMYTAWYLAESFASVKFIRELLQDKTFYIAPTVNPDAREYFIYHPNTPNSPRSGMVPFDDDGDGKVDEDKYNDLDGDGNIVMMRRKSPAGRWNQDPDFPNRMVPAKPGEPGTYELLGYEGYDNDGDGLVNEDGIGSYDPNRDWAWNWQPSYIQYGALPYPAYLPETQAMKEYVLKNKNIAGAQLYHNYGGMFLRGPGVAEDAPLYSQADIQVYDAIGKLGEKIIPGYNYLVLYKDLYSVYGGAIDWFSLGRGIFTFTNELMTSYKLFGQSSKEGRWQNTDFYEFDKYLLFGDGYVEWKPFKHPQFGDIEIGGPKKNYIRNHPGFLLEEEAHRNMAFTIFHAWYMPKLTIQEIKQKDLGGGLTEITATVLNERLIPTHSDHDIKNKITRPDFIRIKNASVLAGMVVENEDLGITREQKFRPEEIELANIPGMSMVKVRWIVKGKTGKAAVEVDSEKGGFISREL